MWNEDNEHKCIRMQAFLLIKVTRLVLCIFLGVHGDYFVSFIPPQVPVGGNLQAYTVSEGLDLVILSCLVTRGRSCDNHHVPNNFYNSFSCIL